ncbi:MAG: LCP family protein, partial [Mycobacterium sp.]
VTPAEEATVLPPTTDKRRPSRAGRAAPASTEPRRGRVIVAGRAMTAIFAVLALAVTGAGWQWTTAKNNSLNNVHALDQESRDIIDPSAQFGDENFLIVGVDTRAGANSEIGAGDQEDAGGARSDTVILVNIPANRERVVAVSFPRDLAIEPTECDAWNPDTNEYGPLYDEDTGTYGPESWYTETKLNSAYSYGGPKCLVKVIQQMSGLRINRFMAVDFVGFSKVVDALGGVEVCSTTPLVDYELGTVLAESGRQIIDGHTALNYVRARQVTTEINGDYGRIKRQQLFLSSLLRSMISSDTFFNLSRLNNVVDMFIGDTTVDNVDTKDLVNLGQSLQNVAAGRISFVTVPTVGYADEWGNEVPRDEDIRALFDAIINDEPLPGEANADGTATTSEATPDSSSTNAESADATAELVEALTTEPTDITVHVSNSTGESGLAATAASELQLHGYTVTSPDDYPSILDTTTVFFSPGNEEAAATVASSFSNPNVERVSGMGNVVQVVLGSDFYTVEAPPPTGSEVQVEVTQGTYEGDTTPAELPEDLTVTNAADTTCE